MLPFLLHHKAKLKKGQELLRQGHDLLSLRLLHFKFKQIVTYQHHALHLRCLIALPLPINIA